MKNKQSEIKKNKVADVTIKKIGRADLWRYRGGLMRDSYNPR